jgi:proprotein convertase subtilisin/kexin type 5
MYKKGYYESDTSICAPCDPKCQSCNDSSENSCLACDESSFRVLNYGLKTCECMDGYYNIPSIVACGVCHINCETCTGPLSTDCLTCDLFKNRIPENGTCSCYFGNLY